MAELNMYKAKFDPSFHTAEWLKAMETKHTENGTINMSAFAKDINKSRKTLYSWVKKIRESKPDKSANKIHEVENKKTKPIKRKKKTVQQSSYKIENLTQIPTVQQMLNWLEEHPNHVDYKYFHEKGHMIRNRALARAVLDVVRDMNAKTEPTVPLPLSKK